MNSKILIIILGIILLTHSCQEKRETKKLTKEKIEIIKNSSEFKLLSHSEKQMIIDDLDDSLKSNTELKKKGIVANYDTKCRTGNRVCCSNCTANGDPNRCAKTRFKKCSVCNHSRGNHYASRR
ncbi:hypothetical protein H3Z83_03705 [Tenacibaculum sp. S7007]|uniref:Uncharacterized protein n=1 Tax=Tenacibaculum pelagium TaxID=2759527 RepID=A0A839AMK7_9FLAO|nr:hypothetical protein [Tenacibaculum pelagium]MBA6155628.1 hypothetical protein [Tenacibaculum pelagium]